MNDPINEKMSLVVETKLTKTREMIAKDFMAIRDEDYYNKYFFTLIKLMMENIYLQGRHDMAEEMKEYTGTYPKHVYETKEG